MSDIDWTPVGKALMEEAEKLDKKQRQVNTMNDKVCKNCKWFKGYADRYGDGHCTRFPMWVETVLDHYCGEWKDNNDD